VPREDVAGVEATARVDQRPPEVPRHRRVVRPAAGRTIVPRELEGRRRIGDLLAAPELERRAQGVSDREAQDAADHPFSQVIHVGAA
jgi:hypothetical protein